jgi:glycosyltransferase involved in cell wall biosynthesis
MAVHFRISQADEWADKDRGQISSGGRMFRAIRSLERATLLRVDGIVYVSRWGRDALLNWFPEAATVPSVVIGNFVAPLNVNCRQEPTGDLVSVGNLEAVKNHRYLLEVLAKAKQAGQVYMMDIFGEGPMRKDLQQRIRSLGLERQVRLRGFRADVRDSLPGYRACVHASYSESLPLAIIEAMAAGLPVVAADTGGVAELFDEGVEGRFWPLDDPVRAAAVLSGLMDDEARRSIAAAAARARFSRDFDAEVIAPRLLSFVMGSQQPAMPTDA